MKKILVILSIILLILYAGSYFLIPQSLKISSTLTYATNGDGLFRYLTSETNWKKWWPGSISEDENNKPVYTYAGYNIQINKILYRAFDLNFIKDNQHIPVVLKVISLSTDSVLIDLDTQTDTVKNPLKKILNYFQAKKIISTFNELLAAIQTHTSSIKELYGFEFVNEKVQMQHLLSTSKTFSHYPTTQEIYLLIDYIRSYINKTDGKEEFFPMLNIETSDSASYHVRVGIPVNKKLEETKDIAAKQMVKNGNILTVEVTGDLKTIDNAMRQFGIFITDYQRSIIAIPFQSLITDRRNEPDSTKWITKIYYPVV